MQKEIEDIGLFDEWEKEAAKYQSLKELEEWWKKKKEEIWRPYNQEIARLTKEGQEITAKLRDEVQEKSGCLKMAKKLDELYSLAIQSMLNEAARKVLTPNSEEFREIIEKYDRAWKELALR